MCGDPRCAVFAGHYRWPWYALRTRQCCTMLYDIVLCYIAVCYIGCAVWHMLVYSVYIVLQCMLLYYRVSYCILQYIYSL